MLKTNIHLYKHQLNALAYLRIFNKFALFMEQGTGKTLPTIIRLCELVKNHNCKCLVVAPLSVLHSWYKDISLLEEAYQKLLLANLTIINYDKVWRDKTIKNNTYDVIVLDEAHYIKNRNSKRSLFLLEKGTHAKYKYILTGTPISNGKLENIWSLFAFLDNSKKGKSIINNYFNQTYYQWLDTYAYINQYYQPYKYKNVSELQQLINKNSYRVLKEECIDLPTKLNDTIYQIPNENNTIYKELIKKFVISEYDIIAKNKASVLTKARQICSGFVIDEQQNIIELSHNPKLKVLEQYLEDNDKPLIIYAYFKKTISYISNLLKKLKIKHLIQDGQNNSDNWVKYQNDNNTLILICQYDSANSGITLTKADTMLFYEPNLSSNTLEQAKDRIHRIGQTKKCSYIHFLTKNTIEYNIYNTLKNYNDFNEKMFTEYIDDYSRGKMSD